MKITNRIEIFTTPDMVFSWIEDPDRAMEWMTSVKRSEIIRETPNRIGTTFREYIEEDGRGMEMHGIITEFVPNERIEVQLEGEYSSAEVIFSLREKGDMTQLTQSVDLHFKGVLWVSSLFFKTSIKKKIMSQAQNEFAKLKELCEKGDSVSG